MRKRLFSCLALAMTALGIASAADALAQNKRPLTIVVAYPPGGASDTTARLLAERLAPELGRSVVVENRSGADGVIAMQTIARAAPDGNVVGFAAISPLAVTPHVQKLPFPVEAISPLVPVMYSPAIIAATPSLAAKDLPGMIALAKQKPGAVRVGVAGTVSVGTLILHQLQSSSNIELTLVPYKGGGQLLTDALGGQFEMVIMNLDAALLQSIKDGKLTPLAVTGPARVASLPQVPTLGEAGYPAANKESIFGLFLPANVPPPVAAHLNAAVNDVVASPAFKARLADMGNVATGGSASDFSARIQKESASNAIIIREAGLSAN